MGGQAVLSTQGLVPLGNITKGSDVLTYTGGHAASLVFSAGLSPERMVGTCPGQWEFAGQAAFPLLPDYVDKQKSPASCPLERCLFSTLVLSGPPISVEGCQHFRQLSVCKLHVNAFPPQRS